MEQGALAVSVSASLRCSERALLWRSCAAAPSGCSIPVLVSGIPKPDSGPGPDSTRPRCLPNPPTGPAEASHCTALGGLHWLRRWNSSKLHKRQQADGQAYNVYRRHAQTRGVARSKAFKFQQLLGGIHNVSIATTRNKKTFSPGH